MQGKEEYGRKDKAQKRSERLQQKPRKNKMNQIFKLKFKKGGGGGGGERERERERER